MLTVKQKRGRPQLSRTDIDGLGHEKSYSRYIASLDFKRAKIESKKSTKLKGDSKGWTGGPQVT